MVTVQNECVGCPPNMGCLGEGCPYRHVVRTHCDKCGFEETLYEWDGDQLCLDCILEECGNEDIDEYEFKRTLTEVNIYNYL